MNEIELKHLIDKAELGDSIAQNNLAYYYVYGIGVEKDLSSAIELFSRSAKQGNTSAQNNLAYCYQNGIGVEKDLEQAFKLYKEAAKVLDFKLQSYKPILKVPPLSPSLI